MAKSKSLLTALTLLTLTATPALALCSGPHTFGTCADGIVHWYDPDTGEICDPLDCGGGRAPVKTNVPGCAAYKGTLTRPTEASYMPCFTNGALVTAPAEPTGDAPTTTLRTTAVPVVTSSAGGQADETDSAGAGGASSSSSSQGASPSEGAGGDETTGAASASTPLTTAPPASTPPANAGAGNGGDEAGSTSTTASQGAGNVVGASWIAAVAGVAMGAFGVL